ncbi:MAG: phosphatase PAP2 family protein [Candidatus Edwardsbacteria bacterium]
MGPRYKPIDLITIAYLSFILLLAIFFNQQLTCPLSQGAEQTVKKAWLFYVISHSLLIGAIIVLLQLTLPSFLPTERGNRKGVNKIARGSLAFLKFLRQWYPALLFIFFYRETQNLIHLFFPQWFDQHIQNLESLLFGINPSLWLERISFPLLTEWLMFTYFVYFFLVIIVGFALYFSNKEKEFNNFIFACAATFYLSSILFFLYPVEGPRYAMSALYTKPLNGYLFTNIIKQTMQSAAVHGGGMPSSHVAVALICLIYSRKANSLLFWVLFPIVISMAFGAVYGRFHYVTDVIVGLIIGAFFSYLSPRVNRLLPESSGGNAPP